MLHWQGETPRKGSRRDNCPRDAVRVPERVLLQGQVGFLILIPAPRFCRGTSLSKEQCVRGSVCGSGSAGSKGAAALGAGVRVMLLSHSNRACCLGPWAPAGQGPAFDSPLPLPPGKVLLVIHGSLYREKRDLKLFSPFFWCD